MSRGMNTTSISAFQSKHGSFFFLSPPSLSSFPRPPLSTSTSPPPPKHKRNKKKKKSNQPHPLPQPFVLTSQKTNKQSSPQPPLLHPLLPRRRPLLPIQLVLRPLPHRLPRNPLLPSPFPFPFPFPSNQPLTTKTPLLRPSPPHPRPRPPPPPPTSTLLPFLAGPGNHRPPPETGVELEGAGVRRWRR